MVNKKGFSLVEIIVALVIIAIALRFILPNIMVSAEQTKAEAAKENLLAIAAAQSRFNEDYSSYCSSNSISPCYCISTGTNPTTITSKCGDTNSDLNTNLRLNIPSSDPFSYSCTSSPSPYQCTATDNTDTLTLTINAATLAVSVSCVGTPNNTYCPS